MKRIFLFAIVLLGTVPVLAGNYYSFRESRYRVRWSPYTFGLVAGNVKYSPYTKASGGSGLVSGYKRYSSYTGGLVSENVRYSPYAHGVGSSGLVSEPWQGGYGYFTTRPGAKGTTINIISSGISSSNDCSANQKTGSSTIKSSSARAKTVANAGTRTQSNKTEDDFGARELITAYLKSRGIAFRTNRTLSVRGTIVSQDYILEEYNYIIKFWDSKAIDNLKQANELGYLYYQKYIESYKEYCKDFITSGGDIYQIISSNNIETMQKLLACEVLNTLQPEKTTVTAKLD